MQLAEYVVLLILISSISGLILSCMPTVSSFRDKLLFVFKETHWSEGGVVVEVCADRMYCN